MQFTTTEEHAQLVEKARALLSHGPRRLSLGELHLQAMRLLVEALEKKRFGAKSAAKRRESKEAAGKGSRERGQRSRSIPAALRRLVYERDQGRCTFVDERGDRCAEAHLIQLHHRVAFASGGGHTLSNLTLRCAAHNALAAEQDFGRSYMDGKRDDARHEARKRVDSS
jgi:hypothetical protein